MTHRRRRHAAGAEIQIVKGNPTDEELAALVTVLAGASGGTAEPGPQELNLWGHPVDKLRYRDLQLAAGHAAGTDAHAPMTRVVLGVGLTGPAQRCCAKPASTRWSSSPASTRTPLVARWVRTLAPGDVVTALAQRQGRRRSSQDLDRHVAGGLCCDRL